MAAHPSKKKKPAVKKAAKRVAKKNAMDEKAMIESQNVPPFMQTKKDAKKVRRPRKGKK